MAMNIPAAANRIFQEFKKDLFDSRGTISPEWGRIASEMPSKSLSSIWTWIANSHQVREFLGPRIAKNMSARTWEVTNRKWELSYEFTRDQIADDLEGLVAAALMDARGQALAWVQHEDKLVADTVELGISALCHDGQFFFDTDHPTDPDGVTAGTYDNDLTLALSHANYKTALESMLAFKNEAGLPMVQPGSLTLMVPPNLAVTGKQIVEIDLLTPGAAYGLFGTGGQSQNPFVGSASLYVNRYLTDTTRWYLLGERGGLKPFLFQRREALQIEELGPGSQMWINEQKCQISGTARHVVSYTLPQLAITSKP